MTTLAYRTTTDLTRALAAGDVSSLELLDHLLARIEALDAPINAVVALDADTARSRAREADAARARGESWGALHGLPMTIKDSIEVVGMPTTSGAPELAAHRPTRHADTVQRLVAAGAIVFGKTNLPLYAGDFQSYNDVYGTTNNPWDVTRGPGGSSGGSAAALAAGFTPLELGSDIGGSIRNPAHYCGVFGHKPSYGIVSSRGHIPGPPGSLSEGDLSVLGPMARSAEDLALGLDVLSGASGWNAKAWRLELPPSRHRELTDFRVALWLEQPGRPLAADVGTRIQSAADAIARKVAVLDDKARPAFDAEESHARYLRLLWSVMATGFPPSVVAEMEREVETLDPTDTHLDAQMTRGAACRHRHWLADNEARQHLRAAWDAFFADFDILLCPVMPTAAFAHDHSPMSQRTLAVDAIEIPYLEQLFWAGIVSVAYLPSTVVPLGPTPEGLPVGVQVVAPYLEDRTALRFARLLEQELGGFTPPPGFEG